MALVQTTRLTGGYDLYFRGHLDPFLFRSLLIFNIFYKFAIFDSFILSNFLVYLIDFILI